jgi:phenylacetate-CoA ligase
MTDRSSGYYDPHGETLPFEQKRAFQEQQLRETVQFAYGNAEAVRRVFADLGLHPESIRSFEDLQQIPVTKKSQLIAIQQEAPPFGGRLTRPLNALKRIYVSPGPIFDPLGPGPADPRCCKCLFAAGIRPGDIVQNTFLYHFTPFGLYFDDALVEMGCTVVPAGVGNTELQAQVLRTLAVDGYIGTPSFLKAILEKVVETGFDLQRDLALKTAVVGAEMLSESLRDDLEVRVGMKVRQAYGTADVGLIGHECPEKNGYHLFDQEMLFEITDPQTGRQLPPGEIGELVVTSFNPAYPLLRFGTGDLTSLDETPCACGRTAARLPRLLGRADQVTKVRAMFIHPSQVDRVTERHPEIGRVRVLVTQQDHQDEMTFEVELAAGSFDQAALEQRLIAEIREIMHLRGSVTFVPPGTIPAEAKKIEDRRRWD